MRILVQPFAIVWQDPSREETDKHISSTTGTIPAHLPALLVRWLMIVIESDMFA
jgi:hypothetical protein